jgi:hypothetical protein|nr:MAG TPA: hypothetical protein [Caudoviricetes sp.]
MFVLKIATTVWLALIAFGMVTATLNEKVAVSTRLLGIAVMFGQILAIAFMWQ